MKLEAVVSCCYVDVVLRVGEILWAVEVARYALGPARDANLRARMPRAFAHAERVRSRPAILRTWPTRPPNLTASPNESSAVDRLRVGELPTDVLDERFVDAFAIAGTAEDCLAQARRYRAAGATEVVLTFVGPQPELDMGYLAARANRATG